MAESQGRGPGRQRVRSGSEEMQTKTRNPTDYILRDGSDGSDEDAGDFFDNDRGNLESFYDSDDDDGFEVQQRRRQEEERQQRQQHEKQQREQKQKQKQQQQQRQVEENPQQRKVSAVEAPTVGEPWADQGSLDDTFFGSSEKDEYNFVSAKPLTPAPAVLAVTGSVENNGNNGGVSSVLSSAAVAAIEAAKAAQAAAPMSSFEGDSVVVGNMADESDTVAKREKKKKKEKEPKEKKAKREKKEKKKKKKSKKSKKGSNSSVLVSSDDDMGDL